jgi:hypothetical protein
MTMARAKLVDIEVTRWYHCITRCVRRAFLLAEGVLDRKLWLEKRLEELAEVFAISVGGFAVLDNHLHVLVRLNPARGEAWSDEDVVRRWGRLFPHVIARGSPCPSLRNGSSRSSRTRPGSPHPGSGLRASIGS